jgi:hypothetical protein
MNIGVVADQIGLLYPPRKEQVKKFTVWVQVTDKYQGIFNRSQGSMVAEYHGVFDYTDKYLDQFKK